MSKERKIFKIEGMHCQNCANRIKESISKLKDTEVEVDLETKKASFIHPINVTEGDIKRAIEEAGYSISE